MLSSEKQAIAHVIRKRKKRFSNVVWPVHPDRLKGIKFVDNTDPLNLTLLHLQCIFRPTPGNDEGNTIVLGLCPPKNPFTGNRNELKSCSSCVLITTAGNGKHDICNRQVEALNGEVVALGKGIFLFLACKTGRTDRFTSVA